MELLIQIVHLTSAVLLVIAIVSQNRGSGLSVAIGGSDAVFYATKRGPERVLHYFSIVAVILFLLSAVASLFV